MREPCRVHHMQASWVQDFHSADEHRQTYISLSDEILNMTGVLPIRKAASKMLMQPTRASPLRFSRLAGFWGLRFLLQLVQVFSSGSHGQPYLWEDNLKVCGFKLRIH